MLKRTAVPFYGKKNQRLEEAARQAAKDGDLKTADALFKASADNIKTKKAKAKG